MNKLLRHTNSLFKGVGMAFAFLLIFEICSVAHAAAPVVDPAVQASVLDNLESRIKRVETRLDNQGLVDLLKQFEQMQDEMQRIVGNIEIQTHELQTLKKQQKDMYADIDRRLRKLEQSISGAAPATSTAPAVGGVPTSPVPVTPASGGVGEVAALPSTNPAASSGTVAPVVSSTAAIDENVARSAYERAFNLLKQSRYQLAITSFKAFLETYPDASYADNAQYWIAEANYATKNYKVALVEFKKVIDNYPNTPKRADTLLKIGYTYAELGDKKQALQTLSSVTSAYPNTTVARLAQSRIKSLQSSR